MMAWVCLLPVQAQNGMAEQILGGLLSVGAEVLQERGAKQAKPNEETSAAQQPQKSAGVLQDMYQGFLNGGDFREIISAAVKDTLKPLLDDYKAEGREYAEELGDMLAEKVLNSPKVQETLFSVRVLCWGVIGYLTLISILMMVFLIRVMRQNSRVLAAVEAMQKKIADR